MKKVGGQLPLLAYISANRLGHQAWETIMHCSYASSKGRRLIVLLSPGVVNKAFYVLNSDRVRFIYLPCWLPCVLGAKQATSSTMKAHLKSVLRLALGKAAVDRLKQVKRVLRLGSQSEVEGEVSFSLASPAEFRWSDDSAGRLFDRLTLKTPSLRSAPFRESKSGTRDGPQYYDYPLARTHFRPQRIQRRFVERGETLLGNLGLSPSDWYVCLHARESSSMGDTTGEYRNQEINNCIPAIEHIRSLGGYVIRMGDPSMKPLSSMSGTVDYAHSKYRSSFADLYLCSRARFFIGCTSGLRNIVALFEKPMLDLNVYPLSPLDVSPKSLTIFKRVYSENEERYISLREMLEDPTLYFRFRDAEYRDAGLRIVENTPLEILRAVQEMLGFLSEDPEFTVWTPEQHLFLTRIGEVLVSLQRRGMGDEVSQFYPGAVCRIGSSYYHENW